MALIFTAKMPEIDGKKVLPKLQTALNWLHQTTFEQAEWEQAKEQLLSAIEEFQSHL